MAALEAATLSIFSFNSSSPKTLIRLKPFPSLIPPISASTLTISPKFPLCPLSLSIHPSKTIRFKLFSTVSEVSVEGQEQEQITQQSNQQRRKLFVLNLPWSFTVVDIKKLFAESGTVTDVEIIKQKDGKNRGYAFVTMASWEEAEAVIEKFNSHELLGRVISVEYAKRFKRPSPAPPASSPPGETHNKLYVSNLAWKVRSTNLRELFTSTNFNPVSTRVVFESSTGKSAGYGFVSFSTKEEAESAISALNGKELMGRPINLKFSEKIVDESKKKEEGTFDGQPEES